jgi:hypothetical protein
LVVGSGDGVEIPPFVTCGVGPGEDLGAVEGGGEGSVFGDLLVRLVGDGQGSCL